MATKRKLKTKKVLSGVRTEYRSWDEWDEGDVIIGKYIGSSPNKFNPDKKNWILEVIEAFFDDKKEQKRIINGQRITLNSSGMLDKGMEQATEGEIVQITYNGQNEMQGGKFKGKMAHAMEVQVMVEADEDEEDEDLDDDDLDDEDEDEDEDEDDEEDEDDDDDDF